MNETLPTQTTQSSATPCYLPVPTNFEEAYRIAKVLAASDLVPKDYKGKPENCLVAMQWGADIGMAGLQALQNIAVINGRPSIWGDAAKALVLSHKSCEDIEEYIEGEGNEMVAVCIAKRKGKKPSEQRFSVADAKTAGLWGKQGPWTNYPKRMLQMRARGFSIRDAFPDVLRGLILAEEAQDYTEKDMGAAVVVDDNGKPVPPTTQTPPRKPPTKTTPDATPEQTPAENGGSPIPPEFTDTKKPESTVIDGTTGEIVDAEKPPKATPAATTTSANSPMASEGLLKVVRTKLAAANIEESFVLESFNLESLNAANTTLCNEIIKWAAENAQ
jgi:hypothetical protein